MKDWDDHYEPSRNTVNTRLWDTLQTMEQYSEFLNFARQFHLDSVIRSSNSKTLFIPDNEGFATFLQGDTSGLEETMGYHITPTLFMLRIVEDQYKLRTLEEKYALITNQDNEYFFDDVRITYASPDYLDGKYYEIEQVAVPRPNLWQYMQRFNPSIYRYILTQDSVILDKEKSKPIDYNDQGQTIYDSVVNIINMYEEEYFAISEEYGNIAATIVIPDQEDYDLALDEMAGVLGGEYTSHEDIPVDWQNEELVPVLLHKGTYGGLLEPADFAGEKLTNINGDSIIQDFTPDPESKFLCSNGYVYHYTSFIVADSLFREKKLEAEDVVLPIGLGNFVWDEELVKVTGNKLFQPVQQWVTEASNDTLVDVQFTSGYQGEYGVTLQMKRVFAGRYRLVWRTNYRTSGSFSISINGEPVKIGLAEYDEYDTYELRTGFFSVLGFKFYPDEKGFCSLDAWIDVESYGDVNITIDYAGPGASTENGLSIDYLQLLSEQQ